MLSRSLSCPLSLGVIVVLAGCTPAATSGSSSTASSSDVVLTPSQALAELTALAAKGDVHAKRALGALSLQGIGVPRDPERGRLLLAEAATSGDGPAAAILGNAYRVGHMLPRDDAEALRWLKLAAERGDASGEYGLASLYGAGHGVSVNMAEAVRLYRLSADQRYRQSQTELGILSLFGHGVAKNYVAGYAWLDVASMGAPPAEQARLLRLRDLVGRTLTSDQLARAQATARSWQPGTDIAAATAADATAPGQPGPVLPDAEPPPLPKGTIDI